MRLNRFIALCSATLSVLALAFASGCGGAHAGGDGHAGGGKNPQHWGPVNRMHLYLCAFHVAKENPGFQVEAHHYCSPAGEDIHQCVVFDSKGPSSKLLGVEYIITDAAYQALPAEEKRYWHPHAYEIMSGQLVAPDMPKMGDDAFPGFLNTWGKTWHTWRDPVTRYPTGEPLLMWSANRDGQIDQGMIAKRDAQFGINTAEIRERRKAFGYECPQLPPAGMSEVGRKWTTSGPDEPTKNSMAK